MILKSTLRFVRSMSMVSCVAACSGASGPYLAPEAEDAAGVYIVDDVDGTRLPSAYPEGGADPSCPTMISDGELVLLPQGSDVLPLYSVSIFARPVCDSVRFPTPRPVATDGGRWTRAGAAIQFTSQDSGSSRGRVDIASSPITIVSVFAGHSYQFHRIRSYNAAASYVLISEIDELNNAVGGAMLSWRTSDGLVGCCGVSSSGSPFGVMGPPGNGWVRIWVTPPAGHSLAPSQASPVDVPTVAGHTASVVIQLVKDSTP